MDMISVQKSEMVTHSKAKKHTIYDIASTKDAQIKGMRDKKNRVMN